MSRGNDGTTPGNEGAESRWGSEEFESRTPALHFHVAAFDGPLDLLLHLIQRDKIDIYDIPIAHITEQYCRTIELMENLDLEMAGEFIVMAATLMRIKARMLVPRLPGEEPEEEDPRDELVRQLLEYRKFKEVSESLRSREEERRLLFERGFIPDVNGKEPAELVPVSLFSMIDVLQVVLRKIGSAEFFHDVALEEVTIEEKMELIVEEAGRKGRVLFEDLLAPARSRIEMIVTFLAVLELLKQGSISAMQEATFAPIWIYPRSPEADAGTGAEEEVELSANTEFTTSGDAIGSPEGEPSEEIDGTR